MNMSEEEFNKILPSVLATSEMEGMYSTEEEIELLKNYATGKITEAEFDKKVMELINE